MADEIEKYKYFNDRLHRLIARLLIRKAILTTGFPVDFITSWKLSEKKKPIIEEWNHFNISHSGNYVVIGFSEISNLGIDIEYISKTTEFLSLAHYFTCNEQRHILSSANPRTSFFEIWARKESILKGDGIGIISGLDKFDCLSDKIRYNWKDWHLNEILIDLNYKCYLATSYECQITQRRLTYEELA